MGASSNCKRALLFPFRLLTPSQKAACPRRAQGAQSHLSYIRLVPRYQPLCDSTAQRGSSPMQGKMLLDARGHGLQAVAACPDIVQRCFIWLRDPRLLALRPEPQPLNLLRPCARSCSGGRVAQPDSVHPGDGGRRHLPVPRGRPPMQPMPQQAGRRQHCGGPGQGPHQPCQEPRGLRHPQAYAVGLMLWTILLLCHMPF